MAIAIPIMMMAAAAMSAYGQISAANAQAAAMKHNAQVAEQEGQLAKQAAAVEAGRVQSQTESLMGTQRAVAAANGLTLEGSPIELIEETAMQGELDRLTVIHSGSVAEARAKSQAALDRMQAKAAKTQGYLSAGATILGGASKAMSFGMGGGGAGASA